MVKKKAAFKKVNYTEEFRESGSKKTAGSEEVGSRSGERTEALAEKEAGALFAEKMAGKKMVVISEEAASKKRSSEGTPSGQKKKARVEEAREAEVEAEPDTEDSEAYDLTFNYSGQEHIAENMQASADLISRIPCHTEYDFPSPESLVEKDAYKVYAKSLMETVTHANLLTLRYERRVRRLAEKLHGFPAIKAEADKVAGLEEKIARQNRAMNELSMKAEEARQRAKLAEEELERAKVEKESMKDFLDSEMARLRASREHEVNQVVAKCNDKLGRIKRMIADNEEVFRLSALMNQAQAIKDYLAVLSEEGIAIPADKPAELEENFKKFESQFEALEVEEVAEDEFVISPPRSLLADPPRTDPEAPLDEFGTHSRAVDREDIDPDSGVPKDPTTSDVLVPLDGIPVIPDA